MYLKFFGFNKPPFSLIPEPSNLFPSKVHTTAWSTLEYGLSNSSGITVLAGEIGCGKTTLIRRLIEQTQKQLTVGLVSNTHTSINHITGWVLAAFDQPVKTTDHTQLYQQLTQFLKDRYRAKRRAVLVIDEAQNLTLDTLEELRLLHNFNTEKHMLLQLILVGQPPLLTLLKKPELAQLAQRISVDYYLSPLTLIETVRYIQHRLVFAGGDKELMDHLVCASIYYYSNGIPRIINTLCDLTLAYNFAKDNKQISVKSVFEMVQSKMNTGIFPFPDEFSKEAEEARALIKRKTELDISISK